MDYLIYKITFPQENYICIHDEFEKILVEFPNQTNFEDIIEKFVKYKNLDKESVKFHVELDIPKSNSKISRYLVL